MSTSRQPSISAAKGDAKEYFWGCTLNAENRVVEWTFLEEEGDADYMAHTLFLRHAVCGPDAKEGENNVVEIETEMFEGKPIKQPILSLIPGKNNMTLLDISMDHFCPVKFHLISGSGPIHLSGQHVVDYPDEQLGESSMEDTMDEIVITEEEDIEHATNGTKKRKAKTAPEPKSKRGKLEKKGESDEDDESMDEDNEEDEEAEEESEEEEISDEELEEEDDEDSPEKPKKKAKSNAKKQQANGTAKKIKAKKGTKSPSPIKKSKKGRAK
ncbi:uncharacterized protein LOC141899855 isoform X2 [Tubulanus polymorphus]|uniref:uncharacterized protein LOC141899855 isoform X2 n=1 Tax=Tubulanus polymorphus TaxID=672921 RepID=UPI003DA2117E